MKMACIVFDQMTTLDFIGFFDPVTMLSRHERFKEEGFSWDLCSVKEEVKDDRGLTIPIQKVKPHLSDYDLIFVPGGMGTRTLKDDASFIAWLKTADERSMKVSVCTGALLLGAAGWLQGRRATTNPSAYELLVPYCKEVVQSRIVMDGQIITGGGVAASLDTGLFLVELLTDVETVRAYQKRMDYPYYQPGKLGTDYNVL